VVASVFHHHGLPAALCTLPLPATAFHDYVSNDHKHDGHTGLTGQDEHCCVDDVASTVAEAMVNNNGNIDISMLSAAALEDDSVMQSLDELLNVLDKELRGMDENDQIHSRHVAAAHAQLVAATAGGASHLMTPNQQPGQPSGTSTVISADDEAVMITTPVNPGSYVMYDDGKGKPGGKHD
jgi:hypothetical protein